MKKIIIAISLVLVLAMGILLVACGKNNMTDEGTNKPSSTNTETVTDMFHETETVSERETVVETVTDSLLDEAESKLEEMSEDATHGVEDSTGGHSTRGGKRTLIPRGK